MGDEEIRQAVDGFLSGLVERDVDKALSFFADGASYTCAEGVFSGKDEIRRYLTWLSENVSSMSVAASGIGFKVCGDFAVYEHTLRGTYEGVGATWLALCVYEFSGDKIRAVRSVYDRLSIMEQTILRWPASAVVGYIVGRAEAGLI